MTTKNSRLDCLHTVPATTADELLSQVDTVINPLLADMIVDYERTSQRCDLAYYVLSSTMIVVTALIPALSSGLKLNGLGPQTWVVPTLGIVATILASLSARFRFDERGHQWTKMLVEMEAIQAQWDLYKLSVRNKPLDQVQQEILVKANDLLKKVWELERRDVSTFYKGVSERTGR